MADGADLAIDETALDRDIDRLVRARLAAGTSAVNTATKGLERRLESATAQAGAGRLSKAWASKGSSPGPHRNPSGIVYVGGGTRSRGAITYWTTAGSATPRGGGYFALPLPAAGKPTKTRGGDYQLTPQMWEQRTGLRLRPVFRPGKAPILVADDARLGGRGQTARATRGKGFGPVTRGSATVPIFVLIPNFKFRNAISIPPMVAAAEREIVSEYAAASSTN
uniref:DUF6441 family protein n=1 Tax=uncultured Sphingomonas sp. TaxID=158754 RepID=UPI0035CC5FF8